jgi:hypothetical protein
MRGFGTSISAAVFAVDNLLPSAVFYPVTDSLLIEGFTLVTNVTPTN